MLTEDQRAFYQEQGYVLVKGLFSQEEADVYRQECHALLQRLAKMQNLDATWGSARVAVPEARTTQVLHCHDVQFYSAAFSRLLVDERLTAATADLIGSPNVQLHHTKIFVKPPERGSPFPMHQDYPFFPHTRSTMLAAIVHFDAAPVAKGCIRVVPGSHRLGPLAHEEEGGWHLPFSQYPITTSVPCEALPGDVLFLSYLTIHGSGINSSNEARTTLLVQMRDPLDRPAKDVHRSRGQGMILRGIDPLGIMSQNLSRT